MSIDNRVERVSEGGNLLANLGLIDVGTWQSSAEVFADWQKGARVEGVITCNLGVYRCVDGEAQFDLLEEFGNPFVDERFRKQAYDGILASEFFVPSGGMKDFILAAVDGGSSVSVPYSGLGIKTDNCGPSYGFVEVGENNTADEKRLISGAYGTDSPGFGKKILLLREGVVKSQLKDKEGDLFVRACYLDLNQGFYALGRSFSYYISAVRGVRRRVVAEGDVAPKIEEDPILAAYNLILDPQNREKAMSLMTPEIAGGMHDMAQSYLGMNHPT